MVSATTKPSPTSNHLLTKVNKDMKKEKVKKVKGKMFLVCDDKFKRGKRKGGYKYIEFVPLTYKVSPPKVGENN